jgi:hypothetical protein
MVGLGLWARHLNAKAASWPATQGTILSSVLEDRGEDAPDAKIRYSYEVAGQVFESSNISYGGHWSSQDRDLVAKYPIGAQVSVYFDPSKPARAALEREESLVWAAFASVGLFFTGLAIFYP